MSVLELDHLVVAARSLDEGAAWCEATLGVTPGAGGRHPLMATHNRVFGLDGAAFPRAYFEIIAVDPQAPAPGRVRWFGMDTLDLATGPRLVNTVARTSTLDALLASLRHAGSNAGRALAAARDTPAGPLHWRIAVRDDGSLGCDGALPTLIEWGARHPTDALPPSGVSLRSVTLRGLPPGVIAALDWQGVRCLDAPGPAIETRLDTPRGAVTLTASDGAWS